MTDLKPGVDFLFATDIIDDEKDAAISIQKGKFEGVIYRYEKVWVDTPDAGQEEIVLNFNYIVEKSNGHDDLETNQEFKDYMGQVLRSLMFSQFKRSHDENKSS